MRGLPSGPLRENAIAVHAEAARSWNPQAATQLAGELSDAGTRQSVVEALLSGLARLGTDGSQAVARCGGFPGRHEASVAQPEIRSGYLKHPV